MSNKLIFVLGFGSGVLLGIGLTKNHYKRIAQEEIDSVKEAYGKRAERQKNDAEHQKSEISMGDYKAKLKDLGYIDSDPRNVDEVFDPYVISPDEFGDKEDDGYTMGNLTYYVDGILTDSDDHPMSESEIEDVIGKKNLERFGEYEDDSVHVRNDRMKCDFEILIDPRSFDEVLACKPYLKKEIEEET